MWHASGASGKNAGFNLISTDDGNDCNIAFIDTGTFKIDNLAVLGNGMNRDGGAICQGGGHVGALRQEALGAGGKPFGHLMNTVDLFGVRA